MRIMALFDSETRYTHMLTRAISGKKNFPFEFCAFTEREKLESFLSVKKPSVALIAEKDYTDDMASLFTCRIIILAEDRGSPVLSVYPSIRKYQPFSAVFGQILALTGSGTPPAVSPGNTAAITTIGVGSPVGRCGKTTYALALARFLADTKPTLFLSLDPYPVFSLSRESESSSSLSDILFDMKENTGDLAGRIRNSVVSFEGLSLIPPVRMPRDAADMTAEDLRLLLLTLPSCGYQTVVLDAGAAFADPLPLLEMCSVFYMPVSGDSLSAARIRSFAQFLKRSGREDLLSVIRRVLVPPLPENTRTPQDILSSLMFLPVSALAMQRIRKDGL